MKKLSITIGAVGCVRMKPEDVQTLIAEWGGGMDEICGDFMDGRLLDNFNDSVVNWELFRFLNIRKLLHKYEQKRWIEHLEMDMERNFKSQEAIRRGDR